jgi:hypothetical protein
MCVYLFCPGKILHIDYAAESITLKRGGRTDLVDLLITNHSVGPMDRVHFIYPHPIGGEDDKVSSVEDLTPSLMEADSEHNDFLDEENA